MTQRNPLLPFKFILTICVVFVYSWSFPLHASPIPGVGSSILTAPEHGLFFSSKGFKLSAPSVWMLERATDDKESPEQKDEFSVIYTNPQYPSARLTVKTDTLRTEVTLEAYAKKWMKDYSSYGFDVLGAKTFAANQNKGLVVDLIHKKHGTQLRQVIFLRKKTAVTLTCLDQAKMFNTSLLACNQILKSFSWNANKELTSSQKSF